MNWLENFKPEMVVFVRPCMEDPTARVVQAVCADRVFKVRLKIALGKAGGDKRILKLLEGHCER
jgi:hypothetical protein